MERTLVLLQIIVICVVLITASYSPIPSKQQLLGVRDGNLGENLQLMAGLPNRHGIPGTAALGVPEECAAKCLRAELGAPGTQTRGVRAVVSPSTRDTNPSCARHSRDQCSELLLLCSCHTAPH